MMNANAHAAEDITGTNVGEDDSRTNSILAKRPLEDVDDASSVGKRPRLAAVDHSGEVENATSSPASGSDDGEASSEFNGSKEDDDEIGSTSSGDEDCGLDIIESADDHTSSGVSGRADHFSNPSAQNPDPSKGHDLDRPLAEILQRLPTKKEYVQVVGKRKAGSNFERQKGQLPVRTNLNYVKRLTQSFHKYHEARNRVQRLLKNGRANIRLAEDAVREAKVDFAWCVYYPVDQIWQAPPNPKWSLQTEKKPSRRAQKLMMNEAKKRDFAKRVAVCLEEDTLLDLRLGKIGRPNKFKPAGSDIPRLQEGSQIDKLSAEKKAQLKKLNSASSNEIDKIKDLENEILILKIDYNYNTFYPSSRPYLSIETFKKFGEDAIDGHAKQNGLAAKIWNSVRSMSPRDLLRLKDFGLDVDGKEIAIDSASEHEHGESPPAGRDEFGSASPVPLDSSSLLNLSPDPQNGHKPDTIYTDVDTSESGEISTSSDENMAGLSINLQLSPENATLTETQLDGSTEMMPPRSYGRSALNGSRCRKTLSALSPEDLNMQLRYFHAHAKPEEVALDRVVRCFCCGAFGHLASECEKIVCTRCDAYNMHIDKDCDIASRCSRCGKADHSTSSCEIRSSVPAAQSKSCGLCLFQGHEEEDCEMLWRTSGAPWKSTINPTSVRLFCYECGSQGHLGNDCPNRQPGKALGTSTWSLSHEPPSTRLKIKSKLRNLPNDHGGLSIKGRADNRANLPPKPPPRSGEDRDFDNPSRLPPKLAPKGRIQINPGIAKSSTVDSFRPDWTPVSHAPPPAQPSRSDERPRIIKLGSHEISRDPPPACPSERTVQKWPEPAIQPAQHYPNYEADLQYEYQHSQQNPMRPPPRYEDQQQAFLGNYAVQTPQYQQPAQQRRQSYQPMPSSAKKAWGQFRR